MAEQNEQNDQQNKQEVHCWDANNPEHIKKTFVEEQGINRNVELCALVKHLQSNRGRHYVVALDGEWGCGKSFFVRHTILLHDAISGTENGFYEKFDKKKEEEKTRKIAWKEVEEHCKKICGESAESRNDDWKDTDEYLYYDAWKNDAFDGEPIISILCETLPADIQKNLSTALKEVFTAVAKIYLRTFGGFFKFDFDKAYQDLLSAGKENTIYNSHREYVDLHEKIESVIQEALNNRNEGNERKVKRFIIFIDELDRCNPRFAVKVLERVKHFFDNENLVFVFSVNLDQLQHTIKEVYGQNFDAMNYLHRFFDYQITLSTPDMEQFVGDKLNFIVEEADAIRDSARYAIESYELSIRDTIRYIDALKIVYYSICAELKKRLAEQKEDVADTEQPAYRFVLEVIAPLLLGQKIADADRYNTIVSQRKVQEYDKKPLFKERITNYLTTQNIKYAEYLGEGESDTNNSSNQGKQKPTTLRKDADEQSKSKKPLEKAVAETAYDRIFPLNQKQNSPWGEKEKYVLSRATRKSLLSVMGGLAPQLKGKGCYTKADFHDEKKAGTILPIEVKTNIILHFVWCPAGTFMMGSPKDELGRWSNETPHEVRLTKGFWIGQYSVTQIQYAAITGENPSYFKGDNRPVERVTWHDSVAFCEKLNQLKIAPSGYRFALPTEAQWEYACRAGTTTALNNGMSLTSEDGKCRNLDEVGWYDENSDRKTHPVMEKDPNTWGIYDMHGNVLEWCMDCCSSEKVDDVWLVVSDTYRDGIVDPLCKKGEYRVLRGGNWGSFARNCRSANRGNNAPDYRGYNLGFRLALVPEQKTASA